MPRAVRYAPSMVDEALSNPLQQAPYADQLHRLQMARPGPPSYGLTQSSIPGAAAPGKFAPFQGAVRDDTAGQPNWPFLPEPDAYPEGAAGGWLNLSPWNPLVNMSPPIEQPRWTEAGPIRRTLRLHTVRIWPWRGSWSSRFSFPVAGAKVDGLHTDPPPLAFGSRGPNSMGAPNTNRLVRARTQWGSYTTTLPNLQQQVAAGVTGAGIAPNAMTWSYDIGQQPWGGPAGRNRA